MLTEEGEHCQWFEICVAMRCVCDISADESRSARVFVFGCIEEQSNVQYIEEYVSIYGFTKVIGQKSSSENILPGYV